MDSMICSLISEQHLFDLARVAMAAPKNGIMVEVGVYRGGSAFMLQQVIESQGTGQPLWLFDTFTGIPERTEGVDAHAVGDFNDTDLEAVQQLLPQAHFFVGKFPATLPDCVPPIAFAHVDCDQYESVRQCILRLGPHMAPGGIMYFDDYGYLAGAIQSVDTYAPNRIQLANGKAIAIFN